jgi:6-phospho-3-hexuloisomerase
MAGAAALFADRTRRWFCSGQGRSGLVAQMVAMRLMHVGFDVHAVGEPTAPSIREGDGLVMISGDPQVYAAMMGRHTNLQ